MQGIASVQQGVAVVDPTDNERSDKCASGFKSVAFRCKSRVSQRVLMLHFKALSGVNCCFARSEYVHCWVDFSETVAVIINGNTKSFADIAVGLRHFTKLHEQQYCRPTPWRLSLMSKLNCDVGEAFRNVRMIACIVSLMCNLYTSEKLCMLNGHRTNPLRSARKAIFRLYSCDGLPLKGVVRTDSV